MVVGGQRQLYKLLSVLGLAENLLGLWHKTNQPRCS